MQIDYTPDENEKALETAFVSAGEQIRFVGGFVRDTLLGLEPKDKDFCTTATPDAIMAIGRKAGWTVVPTGLQHGTVTLVINHIPYEITTLRIDTDTDGRHAEVEFTRDFKLDAERRDLTINAMSMDFQGNIFDYFNGQRDVEDFHIRFVGDARKRIEEDYLRVLRFFRFAARFDASMSVNTVNLFYQLDVHEGLRKISKERVWLEMSKLLTYDASYDVMKVMHASGVAEVIGLPGDRPPPFLGAVNSAEAAVALYFRGQEAEARAFCQSWKMSLAETQKVSWMAGNFYSAHTVQEVEDLINAGVNREWLKEVVYLNGNDSTRYAVQHYQKVDFPVKGQDLLDRGMAPGREVGAKLQAMKDRWKESRYTLTQDELLEGL